MKQTSPWISAAILGTALIAIGAAASQAAGQSGDPQSSPKLSAEQPKQLDQLKQLAEQLRKDRDALHAAISQYGWDSDQTDAAEDQLFRDRAEYRKLRRSLRAAGVPVPPGAGFGAGPGGGRAGRLAGRRHHREHAPHHGAEMCDCPRGE